MISNAAKLACIVFVLLGFSCVSPHENNFEPPTPRVTNNGMVVGIFVYDGVYNTEVIASYDVFVHAEAIAEQWQVTPSLQIVTIAPKLTTVQTAEGLRIHPDHGFSDTPLVDILVIPSGVRFEEDIQKYEWTRWIALMSDKARYTIAHGWGSFLLAASGRLEHKKATTFPPHVERLKQIFPHVDAVKDVRFTQDGTIYTSAGGIASYEASLSLVKLLYGEKMGRAVAGGLMFSPDNMMYSMPK